MQRFYSPIQVGRTVALSLVAIALFGGSIIGFEAIAAQTSGPITQIEYLQWLSHVRGATSTFPPGATYSDYVQWARQNNIEPKGGWNPEALLSREAFAQTLAQLFGLKLDASKDPVRALEKQGVLIPSGDVVTRAQVVSVIDDFGFQSRTALAASAPGSPVKGNNGVGNGQDPAPPGNPPVNDGPGTSPGNPGRKPPRP